MRSDRLRHIDTGPRTVIVCMCSFNEPDLNTQANMTPEQAAQAWKTYMEPFAGKAKLVGPAITNGGAPMGEAWLDKFLDSCTQCTFDVLAIHIYDSATNEAYYQSYISDFVSKYNKTTWVTEVRVLLGPATVRGEWLTCGVVVWSDRQRLRGAVVPGQHGHLPR